MTAEAANVIADVFVNRVTTPHTSKWRLAYRFIQNTGASTLYLTFGADADPTCAAYHVAIPSGGTWNVYTKERVSACSTAGWSAASTEMFRKMN